MQNEIFRIREYGIMAVYERAHNGNLPKYFVMRTTDNHILEEFRQKRSADKWAQQNQNG